MGATQYAELNDLLDELVAGSRRVFADGLVGVYLTGSFAVGDADLNSDCDFVVVVRDPITTEQERELRAFHDEIPTRDGFWTHHLEGSYAQLDDLAALDRIGRDWLYIDHGHREMEWSEHCNREVVRWSLRERGVVLAGPRPDSFVAPIPKNVIRARMLADLPTLTEDIFGWAPRSVAWSQRYLVTTYCRVLYSVATGEVASKRASLVWGEHHLDARWHSLLRQVREDRDLGWDANDPPRPGSLDESLVFADWCRNWALSRFGEASSPG